MNIAITGLHATDNPAPGIGVIRCLKHDENWNGKIIGLGYDVYDTGIYDKGLLDHTYLIPYPNQGIAGFLDRIKYIHSQIPIDVIIPTLDSELSVFQRMESKLSDLGIAMFIPSKETVEKRSKENLVSFCDEVHISTPETIVIKESNQFQKSIDDIGFPLYVKGVFYDAYKCNTLTEASRHYDELRKKWGFPVLMQKPVKGEEFDVCCVGGENGELLGSIAIRKVGLTDKGKAWSAITIRNEKLTDFSEKVLKELQWKGPCELEIMVEERTGNLYLLEINPRFPAWIFLCTGAEQNLPKLVVELALGKDVNPLPPAKSGMTFVRHATDMVCPLDYIENLTIHGELHY